jgi:hypothetical protein
MFRGELEALLGEASQELYLGEAMFCARLAAGAAAVLPLAAVGFGAMLGACSPCNAVLVLFGEALEAGAHADMLPGLTLMWWDCNIMIARMWLGMEHNDCQGVDQHILFGVRSVLRAVSF